MQLQNLFDATSALIVVGGTCLATVLRCGLGDTRAALAALAALAGIGGKRFDAARARAELAVHVREMQKDGVIRTEPYHFGDAELDEATDALIGTRSISALHGAHITHKRRRVRQNLRAMRTLNQAADLAPVFGLAGTLISLSQLPASDGSGGNFTAAISMAVLTTLYGLLLGNIVFAPLGRIVARRASLEEQERQRVVEWLEQQVGAALPGTAKLHGVGHGR
ncbi:chemotaxis protein MotA [Novosphingobium sp. CF614]|uniref:MotA/TolQ/ExbB proton channel family protein n=1 Tax=Novosphingobium sp. CF614 TaxID=1884364 RepID=UPI0008F09A88|nr:MotA/TolQ/ExbB proton channel family protein [Novosphingobium sp. CF614]SFF75864.1 chemotaxis protein MotA [Novosphingobium sp. CF614]